MEYIISSSGRPIGTTELGFDPLLGANRSGWFHPNALGETLMPNIALQFPAMRAFVCRNARDADGQSIVEPNFRSSSLFADLAEAFHRVEAMELTLHHPDGTMIPTVQLGIQDTEHLFELARWDELRPEPDSTIDELEWEQDFEPALEDDLELPSGGWQPSDDEDDFDLDDMIERAYQKLGDSPRYQVHVELVDAYAIP